MTTLGPLPAEAPGGHRALATTLTRHHHTNRLGVQKTGTDRQRHTYRQADREADTHRVVRVTCLLAVCSRLKTVHHVSMEHQQASMKPPLLLTIHV